MIVLASAPKAETRIWKVHWAEGCPGLQRKGTFKPVSACSATLSPKPVLSTLAAKGFIQQRLPEERADASTAHQHQRQLRKLQRPVSRQTASIPHIFTLLWRAARAGHKLQLTIPPTLVTVSKASQRAFLYTNDKGCIEIVEDREATQAFFNCLSKRKHRNPIAIHHTRIEAAVLFFSRKTARAALKAATQPFHYMQRYVSNRTNTPELLCSVFRPEKPLKFYLVVPRHVEDFSTNDTQKRHNSLPSTQHVWILDKNDHSKSEILECSQGDAAVAAMSAHLHEILSDFGLGEVTELVTDYMRDKRGMWVFNSIVSISQAGSKAKALRPRTASAVAKAGLSLQSKVVPVAAKPKARFLGVSVLTTSSLVLDRVNNSQEVTLKSHHSSSSLLDIEARLSNLRISHAPQLKAEATQGDQSFPSLSTLTPIYPIRKASPVIKHIPTQYESLMAKELAIITDHYDGMRRVVQEFHDRRANPRRCIYYYPQSFWTDVTQFLAQRLTSDSKAFPMFVRTEISRFSTLVGEFLEGMKLEELPSPIPLPLLELAVELSIPRVDPVAFISILHEAFRACRMREDEVDVATDVYRSNLATLLRFNWKKGFSNFLSKRIMSEEFLLKVMKLQEVSSPLLPRTKTGVEKGKPSLVYEKLAV